MSFYASVAPSDQVCGHAALQSTQQLIRTEGTLESLLVKPESAPLTPAAGVCLPVFFLVFLPATFWETTCNMKKPGL